MISIVTGNKNKFRELKEILGGDVAQLDIDLHEIQEIDPRKIIEHKLKEALAHAEGPLIVEDSSLCFESLGGKLPGPMIKWFLQTLGLEGLAELANKMSDTHAVAYTVMGYATSAQDINFFEGEINGNIVPPRGKQEFGFDPIFLPDGFDQTFAEMSPDQKHAISARGIAGRLLKEYIEKTS